MDERLNEINRELKELNEALARQGLAPFQTLLWNIFPFDVSGSDNAPT